MMRVLGIEWLGRRTERYEEMLAFYRDVMGLDLVESTVEQFALLQAADGDRVELFGPASPYQSHFPDGPVAGFLVADYDEAVADLEAAGMEIVHRGAADDGSVRWAHFVAPDGSLYDVSWRADSGRQEDDG